MATTKITAGLINDDAVGAAAIADGSIGSAAIANDAVTGGKLNPAFVQGDIMYASGTDTIARLAKGSAAEVLTMNSGATAPEWAAAGGGGLVFLSSVTLAGAANYDFESLITSTYDSYLFVINGAHISGANSFGAQVSTNNGSAYKGSSGDYHFYALGGDSSSASSPNVIGAENHARIPLADTNMRGLDTDAAHAYGGYLWFFDVNSTAHNKFCIYQSGHYDNEGDGAFTSGMCMMASTDDIDAVRFLSDTGTLDEGTIQLYGFAKS